MFEAERLETAAWALDRQAGEVENCVRRLRSRVYQTIDGGRWKGPSADNHRRATDDRCGRMFRAAGLMRNLASRFRARARQLREEERRRQAQAAASRR
jgi:hypothetical protein